MDIRNLVSKSVYSMTLEELNALLTHYENHEEQYKYTSKMGSINRAIAKITSNENKEEPWLELAREDKETKEKWESHGAYFKSIETMTKWYYKDEEFYLWWSGVHVENEIHRLREADERFMRLIDKGRRQ